MSIDQIKSYLTNIDRYITINLRGLYNDTIGLIIGQKIRFEDARRIRRSLYDLSGGNPLTYSLIHGLSQNVLSELSHIQVSAILQIPNIEQYTLTKEFFINI